MSAPAGTVTRPPARLSPGRAKNLRLGSFAAFLILVVQFGIGAYVNLYVSVPAADQGAGFGKAIANGPGWLTLHIVVGLVLIASALGVLIHAVLARHPALITIAVLGLISMVGAAAEGARFASSGNDGASLGMAIFTGAGLLCYGVSLYVLAAAPRAR